MKFSGIINALLSPFNLVLLRRRKLDEMLKKANAAGDFVGSDRAVSISNDRAREIMRHQIAAKWEVVDFMLRNLVEKKTHRMCPLCEFESFDTDFEKFTSHCIFGGGLLVRNKCPACDVIFGDDKILQLSKSELSHDYEWHYKVYDEGDSTTQEIRAFYSLNPSKEKIYLNYGAGTWSNSIQQLRDQGWNVYGFEPHGSASKADSHLISDYAALESMRFDGIFSNNVLEHIRYPVAELVMLKKLLKAGGSMAHATPCYEYLYEFTRFHLFFYLGRSRNYLMGKAGLIMTNYIEDGEFMCAIMVPDADQ